MGGVTLPRPSGTARFPYPTRSDPLIHPIDDDGRDHSPRVTKGAAARSVAFARTHGTASPSPIPQSFDLPHGFMPWQARDMPWIPVGGARGEGRGVSARLSIDPIRGWRPAYPLALVARAMRHGRGWMRRSISALALDLTTASQQGGGIEGRVCRCVAPINNLLDRPAYIPDSNISAAVT